MRAKLKEISDELDTLHSYNRELKDRLGEQIAAKELADCEVASLIDRCARYRQTCDVSIITMYAALVIAAMAIGLLAFAL